MSTPHDPSPAGSESPDEPVAAGPRGGPTSRWVVVIPAVALLVGLLLGGAVVGVATGGDGSTDPARAEETDSATEDASDEPATAVIVPDSCLEAAESVEQASGLIRDGIDAVRELRADDIIELLNDLEDLDNLTRQQAETCTGTTVTDAPLETEPTS